MFIIKNIYKNFYNINQVKKLMINNQINHYSYCESNNSNNKSINQCDWNEDNKKTIQFHNKVNNNSKIITKTSQNEFLWDFSLISHKTPKPNLIDCILIQNNIVINIPWLKKSLLNTSNIILADGGANIFYQQYLSKKQQFCSQNQLKKVKAIIGDLDSLKPDIKQYYQSKNKNIEIVQILNQDKNDFQKAVEWISQHKNFQNIFVFGSFGGRLDHTLATISNAEKLTQKYQQLQLVLLGKTNIMCVLRGGIKHKIKISNNQINRKGCGVVTFNKIQHVETTGFRWNLGKGQKYEALEWGRFISTSNQIVKDQITIETFDKGNNLKFVATFVNEQ